MSRKIKPGQLCYVKGDGIVCTAIRFVGAGVVHPEYPSLKTFNGAYWEVDCPIKWSLNLPSGSVEIKSIPFAPESMLIPLNDPDLDITEENAQNELNVPASKTTL